MTDYILEAKDIHYKYPGSDFVLNNISVKIEQGKRVVFLGGNGTGKTTLFLHFNGILKPNKGSIFFKSNEVKYNNKSLKELRKSVGIVFQDPETQLFSASVSQEISFGPINLGMSKERVRRYVDYALEATGTTELKDKPTHFLSYGQKKKVTIASVISMVPEVIIFDEPNTYLDPKHRLQIIDFLTQLNKSGITIILSTHDVEIAYSWADHIVVLNEGQVVREGTPDVIFSDCDLLDQANLTCPVIMDYYYDLKLNNLIPEDAPIPKTREELVNMVKKHNSVNTSC